MDINKINDIVSSILKFGKLLQNINIDTINTLRELKGSEVLVNYENMIEIEPLDTIKGIRNFIINEINSLSIQLLSISKYDNNELKEFIKNRLVINSIDNNKLKFVIDKVSDDEARELIKHKMTLSSNYETLIYSTTKLANLDKDTTLKSNFKNIQDVYNALLDNVSKTLDGENVFIHPVDTLAYGYNTPVDSDLLDLDFLKDESKDMVKDLEKIIQNVNVNISNINYRESLGDKLRDKLMNTVDEFIKGIINYETFEYQLESNLNILKFYVDIVINYINSNVNFIENLETYIKAYNNIVDAVEVNYSLFTKSN